MKIIENKKLFGKINLIDIFIIIVAFCILAVTYIFFSNGKSSVNNSKEYLFQYEMQNVIKQVADNVKIGDKLYDNETNNYVGEIVNVEITNYKTRTVDKDKNEFVNADFPDRYNVVVTLKNSLVDVGTDLKTQDGYVIKVGKRLYSRTQKVATGGYIVYIERENMQ